LEGASDFIIGFVFLVVLVWFCYLCSDTRRRRCEKKCSRCSINNKLIPPSSFKFSKEEHKNALRKAELRTPFSAAQGLHNPYTDEVVRTKQDYEIYIHCFALRDQSENYTKQIEQQCIDKANKALAEQYILEEKTKRLKRSKVYLCVLSFLLTVAFVVSLVIISSLQPNKNYEYLKARNSFLERQNQALSIQLDNNRNFYHSSYSAGYAAGQADAKNAADNQKHNTYDYAAATPLFFVGDKSTMVFHLTSCLHIPSFDNRTYFMSREDALSRKYNSCSFCNP
jgi:hypothetical protein